MKIAYLDCFSGVAGDMLLGALLDAGWPLERLRAGLSRLVPEGVRLRSERVRRGALAGTRFHVEEPAAGSGGGHGHGHGRGLAAMEEQVGKAGLPAPVEEEALEAFRILADAEAAAHDLPPAEIHFHEVGGLDTLVDVCGVLLGFYELGVEEVYSSAVAVGTGTVECAHGVLPVPAPGALGALLGVPVRSGELAGERATPTGAALLRVLVDAFEPASLHWIPRRTGMGAGSRDDPRVPNLLRLTLGERHGEPTAEALVELSCQVDDATGEVLGHAMERLLAEGALDAFFVPVQMKKNRPGTLLVVHAPPALVPAVERVLFLETGTLGVRRAELRRTRLPRRVETRATPLGPVRFKVCLLPDGTEAASPEFEDARRLAAEHRLPLPEILRRLGAHPG